MVLKVKPSKSDGFAPASFSIWAFTNLPSPLDNICNPVNLIITDKFSDNCSIWSDSSVANNLSILSKYMYCFYYVSMTFSVSTIFPKHRALNLCFHIKIIFVHGER